MKALSNQQILINCIITNNAKKDCEKIILEKTEKFHQLMENKKKTVEQKIAQMKENERTKDPNYKSPTNLK